MKRSVLLSSFVLLWLCCVSQTSRAQAPTATDGRDFVGQRLGWSADKIYDAMKNDYYVFSSHLVREQEPGTLLYYTGPKGETLGYFIVDGLAQEASLTIPLGSQTAHDMVILLSRGATLTAFDEKEKIARYVSPYAKITVYPNESTHKLCFWYEKRNK